MTLHGHYHRFLLCRFVHEKTKHSNLFDRMTSKRTMLMLTTLVSYDTTKTMKNFSPLKSSERIKCVWVSRRNQTQPAMQRKMLLMIARAKECVWCVSVKILKSKKRRKFARFAAILINISMLSKGKEKEGLNALTINYLFAPFKY